MVAFARQFDGDRAFALARAQVEQPCATGAPGCVEPRYRVPGTEGNDATVAAIAGWMARLGWSLSWDNFTADMRGQPVPAHSLIAERPGRNATTLYVAAHYDTRPWTDEDPDPAKRDERVLGANDGASGVAVMVALAELLKDHSTNLTLRFAFWDAEDMGESFTGWIQGSEHYAQRLSEPDVQRTFGYVLLDLVGDVNLTMRREGLSSVSPHRALQDDLWSWAAKLGHEQFVDAPGPTIIDDHQPFQKRHIRAVDVLHLDFDANVFPDSHHTTFDDLAHLSPGSLDAVGETTLAAVLAWDARVGPGS